MRTLSKSKVLAFLQCPKRLWLEVHQPDLKTISTTTQNSLNIGYQVGDIARQIYDSDKNGILIDIETEGFKEALARSQSLQDASVPIFEAGFSSDGLLAFADVMLPCVSDGKKAWKMIEVKSSTSVKEYHKDDIAVQCYVAGLSGFNLQSVSVARIDSSWVYPGEADYAGLLVEEDLTDSILSRFEEVKTWIDQARQTLSGEEPVLEAGKQCFSPYECGFYAYCTKDKPKAEYPIKWLPRLGAKAEALEKVGIIDLRDVPDSMLNATQKKVKNHTLTASTFFDVEATSRILNAQSFPAYFLDFETINFPVPIWAGTRPYQQIPFQYSLHTLGVNDELAHLEFLDVSGNDPSRKFSEQLISDCGEFGPIYVYNAGFEGARLRELAERFTDLSERLLAIDDRLFDLLPLARKYFYHPSQHGSWSIKKILPALVPELSYSNLEGVQDGGMAMDAFIEAIHPDTIKERKLEITKQLLAYCKQDTLAMVKIFEAFKGKSGFTY